MSAHLERAAEILEAVRLGVEAAEGPQQVLDAVVGPLRSCFDLHRATIRKVEDVMLELVAVWSAGPTKLGRGMRMSTLASSLPVIVKTGRPVVQSEAIEEDAFAGQVLLSEGIASYVTLPLRTGGIVAGLLSFSSRSLEAFVPEDVPFLEQVAAMIEARLASFLSS